MVGSDQVWLVLKAELSNPLTQAVSLTHMNPTFIVLLAKLMIPSSQTIHLWLEEIEGLGIHTVTKMFSLNVID